MKKQKQKKKNLAKELKQLIFLSLLTTPIHDSKKDRCHGVLIFLLPFFFYLSLINIDIYAVFQLNTF